MTTFHILGAGSIGSVIAVLLPKSVSISVILRNSSRLKSFKDYGSKIGLLSSFGSANLVEKSASAMTYIPKGEKLKNLIITTKSNQTAQALRNIAHAIDQNTNIMLVHNGMGVYEEIAPIILRESGINPHMYLAITTHGAYPDSTPWRFSHNSNGHMIVTSINGERTSMIDIMEKSALNLSLVPKDEFILAQMEKLIVNAYINPLTAILECENGKLQEFCSPKFMHDLVNEACTILRVHYARITRNDPSKAVMADVALNRIRMSQVVKSACAATASNRSSMYQDMISGNESEIKYINGFIERLGVQYGLPKARNAVLTELVNAAILHRKKLLVDLSINGQTRMMKWPRI